MQSNNTTNDRPLVSLDEWEDDLLRRTVGHEAACAIGSA